MLKELTYAEVEKLPNITETVLSIREMALTDAETISDFDLFRLNFNYFEINGEWNHSFVILPKKFFDEVSTDWSSQEFNQWADKQSIYNQKLISALSTDPIKLKTIRSAKFKTL
jgi:hypothetical protein